MIHVKKLTKYYGSFCAVDQINIEINKGEIQELVDAMEAKNEV